MEAIDKECHQSVKGIRRVGIGSNVQSGSCACRINVTSGEMEDLKIQCSFPEIFFRFLIMHTNNQEPTSY
jgi:hypothetical protein